MSTALAGWPQFLRNGAAAATTALASNSESLLIATTTGSSSSAAVASTVAAHASSNSVSIGKHVLVFCLGGLFFSTVLAATAALFSLGERNVRRGLSLVSYFVRYTWSVFVAGIREASVTLRPDAYYSFDDIDGTDAEGNTVHDDTDSQIPSDAVDELSSSSNIKTTEKKPRSSWRWREAWQVFREQSWFATRQAAARGVSALRNEATRYSAVIGKPGLVLVQHVIRQLLTYNLATTLKEAAQGTLQTIHNPYIRQLRLDSLEIGQVPPELLAARIYNLNPPETPDEEQKPKMAHTATAMAFDIDLSWWDSEMVAKLTLVPRRLGLRVPIEIQQVGLAGTVRVQLTPLLPTNPGYGALLVSLVDVPRINLSVRVGGAQVTRVPWLKRELLALVEQAVQEELLWPQRTVVPVVDGKTGRPLLSNAELAALRQSDPISEQQELEKQTLSANATAFDRFDQVVVVPPPTRQRRRRRRRGEAAEPLLQLELVDNNNDGIPDMYQTEEVESSRPQQ